MSLFTEETYLYAIIHQFRKVDPYQTFLFVSNSHFYDGLCYSRELLIAILVHAPNSA